MSNRCKENRRVECCLQKTMSYKIENTGKFHSLSIHQLAGDILKTVLERANLFRSGRHGT